MTKTNTFDYIIIGGGLAGMQLALAFCENSFFAKKQIAIIEPSDKKKNDKTWCFWEKGEGKWEHLLHHKWKKGSFFTRKEEIALTLADYSYKMVRSADFYAFAKFQFEKAKNITWIQDSVQQIESHKIIGQKENYSVTTIFDSRVINGFEKSKKALTLLQPFKGWVIETETDQFDPTSFTMMDYRLGFDNKTCFTYVLPLTKRKALVEFTFFVPKLIEESVYDKQLKKFIKEYLKIDSYSITETEEGVIPMSTYPFWQENRTNYLKIGTGGGWVKASTGYSFKNVERKVERVIQNLKENRALDDKLFNKRFQFYDAVLLNILHSRNELGVETFEKMYAENSTHEIFKFLDEETNLAEEIRTMYRTNKPLFTKSVFQLLKR